MKTIVFFLEEPSAQDALEGLLPRILPEEIAVEYLVFEGKQDLEKRMVRRMRAWLRPDCVFVVLRDQDSGDCKEIKQGLIARCREAGRPDALVRIACRELESWFIGDWEAVSVAFGNAKLKGLSQKATYRQPDFLGSPAAELRKYIPAYQKRDGARRIGRQLDLERNASCSFRVFVEGLRRLAAGGEA
ncbi:DUF4276 family protein [Geoalkalibacter sp.]|uniref:DUF4276 family protein n=1 Tax=Geoalkalibacter sp. TaxID=3041440 RepID=UPI00272E436A|nr:DUF4276 family protein [Geoalkalibacter sp.]